LISSKPARGNATRVRSLRGLAKKIQMHRFRPRGVCPHDTTNEAAVKTLFAVLALAALGFAALPANAASTHHARHHRHHTAYRHHAPAAAGYAYAYQPQIACTVAGCNPVPRGCHPEMGYTPDGTPTGFDVAVCGNTTYYGYRR